MVPELLNNPNTRVRLIMIMLSVGYLPVDCSSPVDSGAPTRTREPLNNYLRLFLLVDSHGIYSLSIDK
jgi:hypothetical protein